MTNKTAGWESSVCSGASFEEREQEGGELEEGGRGRGGGGAACRRALPRETCAQSRPRILGFVRLDMRGALPSMVLSAGGLPRAVVAARAAARLRAEGGPGRLPLARWPQRSAGPPWSAPRAFSTRDKHVWSQEWEKAKLGATPPCEHNLTEMDNVLFVECGFGCDQHGDRSGAGATKAAVQSPTAPSLRPRASCAQRAHAHARRLRQVRACRNAIEFNSIPCIQDLVPGGRCAQPAPLARRALLPPRASF